MVEEVREFILNNPYKLIGVTGGAGSGKSTLTEKLGLSTVHLDNFFIGNSQYRKQLLYAKEHSNEEAYLDATNQYNWWDWDAVESAINKLPSDEKIVVEGALLGPPSVVKNLDVILFCNINRYERFSRLIERDSYKRSKEELAERFAITEYSEQIYYSFLLENFRKKIYFLDRDYNFSSMKGIYGYYN